ncbi:MAG TPA: translation initiation factor IF-2 [Paludibacteraceae bacterium]|nr:translation initiation factor IF-2 [Paludibacteraceae bacterium]HQB69386.1 translation initiation factor IF-2 [Paludibacteraceae bacterium]HRS67894.1 translation initiation factor IF-2 [Paludibacteraceae bacterium]
MARLAQVIKKLNIGLSTAVEFLNKKGEQLENNPNTKLTDEQEVLLYKEFGTPEMAKLEAERQNRLRQKEEKEQEKKVEETPVIEEVKIEIERPHFKPVAKIDLENVGKPKKTQAPKEEITAPKAPPAEVAEEPIKAKTIKTSTQKPAAVKQPKEEKVETVETDETVSNEVFTIRKVEVENQIKMVGKIDLDAINNSTRPVKKSREEKRKERGDFQKKKSTSKEFVDNEEAKTNQKRTEDTRKKRKRIGGSERVEINKSMYAGTPTASSNKKFSKRSPHVTEVSEEDVAKQVKETLARLTQGKKGRKKAAEYRKNKREMNLQRMQDQVEAEQKAQSTLQLTEFVTVNELATMMNVPVTQVIQTCFNLGLFVSINQRLDAEIINIVADEFGFKTEFVSADVVSAIQEEEDKEEDLLPRPPIVTVMGHVDHGKTSLLDYIRKANVIAGEAGGITQHIGAYNVKLEDGRRITFLDTPGHEAFTAMRARGAKVTDIAIIIVAADDGIMPQTVEAINHASAAGVPIVFAINKVDKPSANPDKIKETLASMNYLVEEWGGKYQSQDISAKQGTGVKELLEKVLLEAELLDLKANPNRKATGSVIESTLDKGRGYVATVLVSNGTLRMGDVMLAGTSYGRIKAMFNERNQRIEQAGPSEPVMILGLNGAPQAGDNFNVFDHDHEARDIATRREQLAREQGLRTSKHLTLEELGRRRALGDFHELNVIVKGDVDGSIEALSDALIKLSTEEIEVNVIHKAVGQISESDIMLAAASNAIIIGFQVRPSADARRVAEREEVEIRLYSIIYDAIEELKDAMEGLLSPDIKEEITATLEIRETFHISKVGTIAGCIVKEGKIKRTNKVRLIRDGIVVYTGQLASLKRMKDDVKEVGTGFECGLNIANYNDIKVGDIIEGYEEIEVKKNL